MFDNDNLMDLYRRQRTRVNDDLTRGLGLSIRTPYTMPPDFSNQGPEGRAIYFWSDSSGGADTIVFRSNELEPIEYDFDNYFYIIDYRMIGNQTNKEEHHLEFFFGMDESAGRVRVFAGFEKGDLIDFGKPLEIQRKNSDSFTHIAGLFRINRNFLMKINIDGEVKDVTGIYANINGDARKIVKTFYNINGELKEG